MEPSKNCSRTPPGGFAARNSPLDCFALYEGGYLPPVRWSFTIVYFTATPSMRGLFASLSEGGAPKGRREFFRCLFQKVADRVKSTLVLST